MYSSNVVIRGDGHMVEFSQRLKQLRKDKHLTQAQVAKRIGVTASMVSSYETDIRLPSYEVMVRIADVFGVTVDYLLCRQPRRFLEYLRAERGRGRRGVQHGGAAETKIKNALRYTD